MTKTLSEKHLEVLRRFVLRTTDHPKESSIRKSKNTMLQLEMLRINQLLLILTALVERISIIANPFFSDFVKDAEASKMSHKIGLIVTILYEHLIQNDIMLLIPSFEETTNYITYINTIESPQQLIAHYFSVASIANAWLAQLLMNTKNIRHSLYNENYKENKSAWIDEKITNISLNHILNSLGSTQDKEIKFTRKQESEFLEASNIAFSRLNSAFYACTEWCANNPSKAALAKSYRHHKKGLTLFKPSRETIILAVLVSHIFVFAEAILGPPSARL